MIELSHLLEQAVSGAELSDDDLTAIFDAMLSGQMTEPQIAAFLMAWRCHGETAQLLTVGAKYLRSHALRPELPAHLRPLCDNCGTGGSGLPKFNISTAAAIVAATCGVKLAKHGNRSISSKCGSADLLFEAGFPIQLSQERTISLLAQTDFTFFFAPQFHPVVANVMPTRKSLGIKTVFNLLGPLANPLQPEVQLLGVGRREHMQPMATALLNLGVVKALVVHSSDGLDEISPAAPTFGLLVANGSISDFPIVPEDYGIKATMKGLQGGDAPYNLRVLTTILAGSKTEAAEGVALNAGTLLWLADAVPSMSEGIGLAREKLADGSCQRFFKNWIGLANA